MNPKGWSNEDWDDYEEYLQNLKLRFIEEKRHTSLICIHYRISKNRILWGTVGDRVLPSLHWRIT